MGREAHDVVIIGAGIAGIATAYFLAKAGQNVCVVDKGSIAQESTGRCNGGIGQSHRRPPDLPLVMRSVELWKKMAAESDIDFEYRQQGLVRLAWTDEHAADLKAMVERERAGGLEVYFLDRAETRSIVPQATDEYLGSAYCPSDGSAEPYQACISIARAAKGYGAKIHEHREVTGVEVVDGKVSGVMTNKGLITTCVVVNTAGAWSRAIAESVGVRIPTVVKRSHLMVTEQLPRFLDAYVSTDFYGYYRQALSGNVLIGYSAEPVEGFNNRVNYTAVKIATQRAARIIPRLREASLLRAFAGFTTWTPDYLPIIGAAKQLQGFYLATAFCGLGFAIGPVVGELMAELILQGRTSLSIDAYRPDRFENVPCE